MVDASAPILESTIAAVHAGAGLVVLVDPTANDSAAANLDNAAASNVAAQSAAGHDSAEILQTVLAEAGIELVAESSKGAGMAAREATLELTDLDLLAPVHPDRHTVTGALLTQSPAAPLLRSVPISSPSPAAGSATTTASVDNCCSPGTSTGVLHWTDNRLSIEWDRVTGAVLELGEQIETLYWRSFDRPKVSHWLAAYQLISSTLEPHPASTWAKGAAALPVSGPPKGLTDAVLPDEFPLSMFYEALSRTLSPVVRSTAGMTG